MVSKRRNKLHQTQGPPLAEPCNLVRFVAFDVIISFWPGESRDAWPFKEGRKEPLVGCAMIALGSETDEVTNGPREGGVIDDVHIELGAKLGGERGVHIKKTLSNKARQDRRGGSRTLEDFIDVRPPRIRRARSSSIAKRS